MKHPKVEPEYHALEPREAVAVDNAIARGHRVRIALPTQQHIQGAEDLRELRPRGGRSRTRVLYRRIGAVFVIGAIGPEAAVDPKGFKRAVREAEQRLDEIEE